jgi:hypothetical protein
VSTSTKTVKKVMAAKQPFMRFYYSAALRAKTDAVLATLASEPGLDGHGEALADLVHELIEAGMDYYFIKALKEAEMGFVAEQSARLGMSGAVKLLSSVCRKFITRMNGDQLLLVATHIKGLTTE